MLALNKRDENICTVKKLTDSGYFLKIKSSGLAKEFDVGEGKEKNQESF